MEIRITRITVKPDTNHLLLIQDQKRVFQKLKQAKVPVNVPVSLAIKRVQGKEADSLEVDA